ncbi:MAG: ABC transporter substrate-binding protein [Roseiarcus sp.]|uniref:ABC transporter substrate-binding protein n=1 Tax=Roseiarcus sp. TaxID=1969460 RepID=UPI003C3DD7DC
MRRRAFLGLVGGAAVWPIPARAEQQRSLPRIGYLGLGTAADPRYEGEFLAGLRDLGYVEGKTIEIEFRFTGGDPDEVDKAAAAFVKANVDVIVTSATGVYAARRATTTIPIVMEAAGDVVAMGLAASLAHPGGNVTGSNFFLPELMAKRLELLKEILPSMSSAGALFQRGVASTPNILEVMRAAANALVVDLSSIEVSGPEEFESAFASWAEQKVGAVVVVDIFASQSLAIAAIAAIAAKRRIASIGSFELATAGGLIGYGADLPAMYRRAAVFVDKILKGAKPGDIPIELATKFQTAVNLKTAKALGIDIPPTLLASAKEVIE